MSTAATETGETPAKHRYDERDRRLVLARVGVSVGALLIGAIAGLPQVMERAAGSGFPRGSTRKMGKAVRRVRAIPFISGGKAGPGRTIPVPLYSVRRLPKKQGIHRQGRKADDQRQAHSGRIGLSGRVQRVEGRLSARFGGPAGAASAPVHVVPGSAVTADGVKFPPEETDASIQIPDFSSWPYRGIAAFPRPPAKEIRASLPLRFVAEKGVGRRGGA